MRMVQLKVTNFRCFKEETAVNLDNITVLVGRNDSGKSSLFDAMDIFLDEKKAPEADDRCVHGADSTVRIACVFDCLPKELVIDEQHPTDLASEYLLNGAGNLEIAKVYNCGGKGKGKVGGVFARASHPTAQSYDDLLMLTNPKLKQRANELDVDLSGVNQTINTEFRRAIWAHAADLQCRETDVELKSEEAGRIWEQLNRYLPVFALFKSDRPSTDQDAEAQDPMKAAIKEAIKAQETVLDGIAAQVKKEVQEIADRTVDKIREMNPDLARQLTPRVTTKNWETLFSVSLTGDEDIPINKRGSGTRRLVLLNFFRAKAEKEAETKDTGIIYAIEEPETCQHPNHQKMLVEAFEDIASRSGCQVFLTTHTPVLARRFAQTCLRFVTQEGGRPVIHDGRSDQTLSEITESLGVLPDHDVKVFFGVEGRNDIAFLTAISRMLSAAGESVADLGKAEDDGQLVFVPLGGSNLDLWVSRLKGFNRPEFYLMDRDTHPPDAPKYQAVADDISERPNCTPWTTSRKELENYIHPDLIRTACPGYAGSGAPFEDVPTLFAQAVHEASGSGGPWADVLADGDKLGKKVSNAKKRLCTEFVSRMTPDLLTKIDPTDEVRTWLKAIEAALSSA